ncbi:MBL fold metallo-hydrolase [Pseudalkalibacillus caeni]|uniref:MBL fold metallo-hydrolase n=1 Tax=Exobacillus caeni TaxID=2574798 RepID=A0A5R9F0W2_9BACL|nr:MBL fold metallo-hydrolase [Pseudalkalibacillus caeni]TLS37272.1 MBL fold metallo-hydrolase [Pseudalkalibacillus caeni]
MFFRTFTDEKLAHYSYLVGCQRSGEAIVIDPARNISPYLETAKKEGLAIVAATETHIHADFVSGARQLANDIGAKLYLSDEGDENWKYQYLDEVKHELVKEGAAIKVGNIELEVLHTPGHTPESISFVLTDKGAGASKPMGIFTGDFVFVGDIGRPDLLEKAAGVAGTAETGARQLFDSISKFKNLEDHLQVWPAHGAGSACGKALGAVPLSTVGYEKLYNWALQIENEEEFVKTVLDGQPEPPKYFAMMKKVNKVGPAVLTNETLNRLETVEELEAATRKKVFIDTRPADQFARGHLQGTINVPFNKSFTNWAGWILSYDEDFGLITEEPEAVRESLQSIGLDRFTAYADPSLLNEVSELETYPEIEASALQDHLESSDYYLIDVRNQSEWEAGHIEKANHIMLGTVLDRLDEVPADKHLIVQCQSGARSAIGASILQAKGFKDVTNLKGGYLAWLEEKGPVVSA